MATPSAGDDGSDYSGSRTASETDSDLEYTDSESESSDSYVYPWDTSSNDSWADLSSDEVIQKILRKLPTYDPIDSNEDSKSDDSVSYGSNSDSFKENDDKDTIYDLDFEWPPRLDLYDNEIIEDDDDSNTNKNKNKNQNKDDILRSQLKGYEPIWYLKSYEHFSMYIENKDIDSANGDIDDDDDNGGGNVEDNVITSNKNDEIVESDASGHSEVKIDVSDAVAGASEEVTQSQTDSKENTNDDQNTPISNSKEDENITTSKTASPIGSPTTQETSMQQPQSISTDPIQTTNSKKDNGTPNSAGDVAGAPINLEPSTSETVRTPSPAPETKKKRKSELGLAAGETKKPKSPRGSPKSPRTPKSPRSPRSPSNKKKLKNTNSNNNRNGKRASKSNRKSASGKGVKIDPDALGETKQTMEDAKARKEAKRRKRAESRAKRGGGKRVDKDKKIHRRFQLGDEVIVKGKGHGIIKYMGHAIKPSENENDNDNDLQTPTDNTIASDVTTPPTGTNEFTKASRKDKKGPKKPFWYGIELIDMDSVGDSDGTFNDFKWFECPENKAVFVNRKQIKKYFAETTLKHAKMKAFMKKHGRRHNAQLYGNAVENLFQEKVIVARTRHERAPRKAGPREMGRIHGFVGGDKLYKDELKNMNSGDFLQERSTYRQSKKLANLPKEKKAGPREIGTAHGWKGTKIDEEAERQRIAEQERRRQEEEDKIKQESKKVGPRDIGTAHGWKGTKIDQEKERKKKAKEEQKKREEEERVKAEIAKEKRQGPRDVSKPKNWRGMKYDEKEAERERAKKKEKSEQQKRKDLAKKAGPRDVGTAHGWKGAKFDETELERQRIAKQEAEERKKREKIGKKLGPREIRKGTLNSSSSPRKGRSANATSPKKSHK